MVSNNSMGVIRMSLGSVMVDIEGWYLTPEDKTLLTHPMVGGVILFSRNFHTLEQLQNLTTEIHALRQPALLITVDQEGGRVQRFRDGFTLLPAMQKLGDIYNHNKKFAKHLAHECGWLMASELRSCGIDMSFAPVVDLSRGVSSVIGDRALHTTIEGVDELAQMLMLGMREAGMEATIKHFPGHGSIVEDTHIEIAIDQREYVEIANSDLQPFRRLINAGVVSIMIAHVIYSAVDKYPAGFSPFWLKTILREDLHFQGAIFSDDLSMQGVAQFGSYTERAKMALQAGCDMVIVCNNRKAALEVVNGLDDYNEPASHLRLIRLHGKKDIDHQQLVTSERWHKVTTALQKYIDEPSLTLDLL